MGNQQIDLSTCDREPIHLQPSIQNAGFLIGFRALDFRVQVVSESISDFLGEPYQNLIGKFLSEVLPQGWVQENSNRLKSVHSQMVPLPLKPMTLRDGTGLNAYFYFSEDLGVLEFEPRNEVLNGEILEEKLAEVLESIREARTLGGAAQALALGVRSLTDLDRVMIYQFLQPSWNGEVIAEARIASAHSFLGHRFPATDIPKPARELYLKNQMRFIHDVQMKNSPLYFGSHAKPNQKMDLYDSRLRAVAPVHIDYLKNMGVVSSFSVAIVVDGVLWGLLACHHLSSLNLDSRLRTACLLLCRSFALRVQAEEKMKAYEAQLKFETELRNFISTLRSKRDILHAFLGAHNQLLRLFRASGAALISKQSSDIVGITPPIAELQKLVVLVEKDLKERAQSWYVTTRLSDLTHDDSILKTQASGLLACRISEVTESYLLFFRPEVLQTIDWGGDPHKVLVKRDYQGKVNPRQSFETWRETVTGQSLDWQDYEIEGLKYMKEVLFDTWLVKDRLIQELNEKLLNKGK